MNAEVTVKSKDVVSGFSPVSVHYCAHNVCVYVCI